jgi:hypothetical protein
MGAFPDSVLDGKVVGYLKSPEQLKKKINIPDITTIERDHKAIHYASHFYNIPAAQAEDGRMLNF